MRPSGEVGSPGNCSNLSTPSIFCQPKPSSISHELHSFHMKEEKSTARIGNKFGKLSPRLPAYLRARYKLLPFAILCPYSQKPKESLAVT
jgi:hypothetical protein